MKISCLHLAANCNPKTNVFTFLTSDLIAFAFADQIAIYSNSAAKIISSIVDPTITNSRINCIATVSRNNKPLIFCGYDTGSVNVFSQCEGDKWSKIATYVDSAGIISINLLRQDENVIHIFTNNHSSVVKHLVFNNNNQITVATTLSFALTKIIESIASCFSEDHLVVFLAGTDQKIHCYKKSVANPLGEFVYNFSLSGHEDAVTKLVLTTVPEKNHFLLASSSKDGYIRIWKTVEAQKLLQVKHGQSLSANVKIYLQSVLISHESSVTSLTWVNFDQNLGLASSSLDSTICVWGRDNQGNWLVRSRLGQFVGNKNAFFDVITDPASSYLAAVNYTGAALLWKWVEQKFVLKETFTGHFDQVTSIDWNYSGDFLVTVSKDQTTRIITRNKHNNTYHQISRAQIHGYDINAVSLLKVKQNTIDVLVCGADEKVIRILEPPACFANYLNTFTEANLHLFFNSEVEEQNYKVSKPNDKVLLYAAYSEGGTQVLGLMTKMQKFEREKITSYYDEEQGGLEETEENQQQKTVEASLNYNIPPHQDYLIKHTLWPQLNKLYGHPHEIYRLCKSSDSSKLASSCKALDKDSAAIIIWDTKTWKIQKIIKQHSYTVYGIQFSHTDKYFASVSKDRRLAIFNSAFELVYSEQVHLRAINCLSFHINQRWIITGSRDKTVKLHDIESKSVISTLNFQFPVCSVAFCKQEANKDMFAVGLINGHIMLGRVNNSTLQLIGSVPQEMRHSQQINSLKWNNNLLASCSNDHSVRIFEVVSSQ